MPDTVSDPDEKPALSQASSSPNLALLHLLQSAFNRQTPAINPHSMPSLDRVETRERIPKQKLFEAMDWLKQDTVPESNLYNEYSDNFYRAQAYRHRDDRLMQALFDMLEGGQQ